LSWQDDVLDFWFGLRPEEWWNADEALDAQVRDTFLDLHAAQRQLPPESFLGDARTALAAVILFDQFPRNMFRDHADQFMTDPLALAVASKAVDKGFDDSMSKDEKAFLYMPFQHSETVGDQRRSVALFTALGDDYFLGFAKKHLDLIERFGRFPHRNSMLGRAPREAEIAAGDIKPW
jgi:uncharacterized protein (DUF924 family)